MRVVSLFRLCGNYVALIVLCAINVGYVACCHAMPATELAYCSYLGGSSIDNGEAIEVDRSAHRYIIAGWTVSDDYPTSLGAYSEHHSSLPFYSDTFISSFAIHSHTLEYSTYFGGDGDDEAEAMAIDSSGNLYICGRTTSTDLPATHGAYDTHHNGWTIEGFIVSMTPELNTVRWCTYLGGNDTDEVRAALYDEDEYLYVGGYMDSTDFPFDFSLMPAGGAFIAKFSAITGAMEWCGSLGIGVVSSICFSNDDGLIIAGIASDEVMISEGAYDIVHDGPADLFIMKLNKHDGGFVWGTYVGGSGRERNIDAGVDGAGNIYFVATSDSEDFPLSEHGWGTMYQGDDDVVVGAISSDGSNLLWARNIGGTAFDGGSVSAYKPGLEIDDNGNIVVASSTMSEDIATNSSSMYADFLGEQDALLASVSLDGEECNWITYLGGPSIDRGYGVVLIPAGILLLGYTGNGQEVSDLPVSDDAYDSTLDGNVDAFIMEIADDTIVGVYVSSSSINQHGQDVYVMWEMEGQVAGETIRAYVDVDSNIYELASTGGVNGTYTAIDFSVCSDAGIERRYALYAEGVSGAPRLLFEEMLLPECGEPEWRIDACSTYDEGIKIDLHLGYSSIVDIIIYDIRGRVVHEIQNIYALRGENVITWDRCDVYGRALASGVYIAHCEIAHRKLTSAFSISK